MSFIARVTRRAAAPRLLLLLLLLLLPLLAACASGGKSRAAREPVAIIVNNDLLPSSAASIWIIPEASGPVLLGSVGPGQVKTLEYRPPRTGYNYRLRARLTAGREIISNSFSLAGAVGARWDLQANLAIVLDELG